ncbi:uncharacterized protein LOC118219009 [Anguilla anguilla]|uniref:Uncharacterized protein n=1 Tax=Anguilla anguilla TaxID=7936 RepID=A0A9D3LIM7_ANGAN|nr:uncharacterized protein LOC118219009 [Anguilla anguilla]KAG5830809.1 hypothetical protein ANANG_G00314520 [Anguilla anguilla]
MGDSEPQITANYRFRKIFEFLRSDIFIIIAVVLVVVFLAVSVFCCIHRRRQAKRLLMHRLTEIVVVRSGSDSQNGRPKYSFRIRTDQDHATKLVQIITAYPESAQSAPTLQRQRAPQSRPDLEEPGPSGHVAYRQCRSATLDTAGPRKWPRNAGHEERLSDRDSAERVSAPLILLTTEVPPLLSSKVRQMVTYHALKASQSAPDILS